MPAKKIPIADYDYRYNGKAMHYEQTLVFREDLDGDNLPETIRVHETTDFREKVDWFEIADNIFKKDSKYPMIRNRVIELSVTNGRGGVQRQKKTFKDVLTKANGNEPILLLKNGAAEFAVSKVGASYFRFNGIEKGRIFTFEYSLKNN